MKANDTRQDYVRSRLLRAADGSLTVEPNPVQDSSMLSVLAASDALLVRPAHDPARKAGDIVEIDRSHTSPRWLLIGDNLTFSRN